LNQSFDYIVEELALVRSILSTKFNIESTRITAGNKNKEQYRIRIAKSSMPTLQSIVAPHIPPQ